MLKKYRGNKILYKSLQKIPLNDCLHNYGLGVARLELARL